MIFAYYLLKVALCSGLLLGYYWLALRNKAFHQWNRFYLLVITALSLLLPLLQFSVDFRNEKASEAVRYISMAAIDESVVMAVKQKPFFSLSAEQWLIASYVLIASILLLLTTKALKGILKVLRSYPNQKMQQVYFLNTDARGAPYSFLNYLVWNREIDLHSETGQLIFRHELAHIGQKHSLDKIFMLLVLIPFWLNPFFWIIRKELNDIHEFIADRQALESGSLEDLSHMILNALYPRHHLLLTSPFFQSSIKRRLHMFALQNQKINYMSRILVLPILFIVAVSFTIKQEGQKEKERFLQQPLTVSDTIPNYINGSVYGMAPGKNDKTVLIADSVVFEVSQWQSAGKNGKGLLIVNNKKTDLLSLEGKTIISKQVTVYPANHKEAIQLYGDDAKEGVVVLQDAEIVDKKESKLYVNPMQDTVPKKKVENQVFTKVQVEPKFAGDWGKFLQQNLNPVVPVNNGAPAGQYTVIAQFIVDKEGNISDLKTLTKHGYGMEEEVLRMMKLSPKWEPAVQNGRTVTAYRKQPITFVISEDGEQISAATDKLYIGIDNPIKLDFGNINPKDLKVTISQGSIHHKGSYNVARVNTVAPVTIKVALNEKGQVKELGTRTFAADVIKDEKVYYEKIEQQIKRFIN